MRTPVLWIEIPVANFDRAVTFYENVFETKLEVKHIFEKSIALFDKERFGLGLSLSQMENYVGGSNIKPFMFVTIIQDTIELVTENGGTVVMAPTLMRQRNKNGDIIIGSNLIDNQVGYYAEIKDTEGNHLYLYSHS